MPQSARLSHKTAAGFAAVVVGALAYNNWLLGHWLNPAMFKANGSVSEFSVSSQPHYWVFRLLDIISGMLLVAAAWLFINHFGPSRAGRWLLILTAILGLANIADAISTLPCSETLSRRCQVPVSLSLSHYQVPAHGYSSTVIAFCYFFLPLAGLLWAGRQRLWPVVAISAVVLADALTSLGLAIANYLNSHSLSVRTSGAGQEIEMSLLAVWLIVSYLYAARLPAKGT